MSHKQNDIYYESRQEVIEEDLYRTLKFTRIEPGLSLEKIADVIKDVLKEEEVESLIKQLTNK